MPTSKATSSSAGNVDLDNITDLDSRAKKFLKHPNSSNLNDTVGDGTGNASLVFAANPILIAPDLGKPTEGNLTNCSGLPINNVSGLGSNVATFLSSPNSSNLESIIGDKTGNGSLVFSNSPTLIDTTTFVSSNSASASIIIKNTTNDTNGPRLQLVKDKGAAGTANDENGLIQFVGDDANQDQVIFSEIKSQVKVSTDGQEGGKLSLSIAEHDGTLTPGLVIEDGDADGELDVTIGAGSDSVTKVNGILKVVGGDEHTLTVTNEEEGKDVSILIKGTGDGDPNGGEVWLGIQNAQSNDGDASNAWKIGVDNNTDLVFRWGQANNLFGQVLNADALKIESGTGDVTITGNTSFSGAVGFNGETPAGKATFVSDVVGDSSGTAPDLDTANAINDILATLKLYGMMAYS